MDRTFSAEQRGQVHLVRPCDRSIAQVSGRAPSLVKSVVRPHSWQLIGCAVLSSDVM
jgi:hypothetical protein